MKEKIAIVSGGFDCCHVGHIEYFKEAKKLGDYLVVILNSDDFLLNKKGYIFMHFNERCGILEAIKYVDCVVPCIDKDNTVCATLTKIKTEFPEYDLIFCKGGDRTIDNIPEKEICEKLGIEMKFNIGGGKIQSSSALVNNIKKEK